MIESNLNDPFIANIKKLYENNRVGDIENIFDTQSYPKKHLNYLAYVIGGLHLLGKLSVDDRPAFYQADLYFKIFKYNVKNAVKKLDEILFSDEEVSLIYPLCTTEKLYCFFNDWMLMFNLNFTANYNPDLQNLYENKQLELKYLDESFVLAIKNKRIFDIFYNHETSGGALKRLLLPTSASLQQALQSCSATTKSYIAFITGCLYEKTSDPQQAEQFYEAATAGEYPHPQAAFNKAHNKLQKSKTTSNEDAFNSAIELFQKAHDAGHSIAALAAGLACANRGKNLKLARAPKTQQLFVTAQKFFLQAQKTTFLPFVYNTATKKLRELEEQSQSYLKVNSSPIAASITFGIFQPHDSNNNNSRSNLQPPNPPDSPAPPISLPGAILA